MKFYYIYVLLFLLSALSSKGQQGSVSISEPGRGITPEDSGRIARYITAASRMVESNADSALVLLEEVRLLSEKYHYNAGIGKALLWQSAVFAGKQDMDQAWKAFNRGCVYNQLSTHREKALSERYYHLFILYKYAGKTDSALFVLQQSLPGVERMKDSLIIASTYNHIGSVLIDNNDPETAYHYLLKALSVNNKTNVVLLTSYINLAYVHSKQKNPDSVYFYAQKAYAGSKELKYKRYERSASLLLLSYYLSKQDKQTAEKYTRNALQLMDTNSIDNQFRTYNELTVHYAAGRYYEDAARYGRKAMEYISPGMYLRKDVISLLSVMSGIEYELGNPDMAYRYLDYYHRFSDSLHFLERNKTIDRLEQQFRLAEKEKEITRKENQLLGQQLKIRNRNYWILIVCSGIIITLSLSGWLYMQQRNSKRKMRLLETQKELDEIKAMMQGEEKERSRMAKDLHDGVGGLLTVATQNLKAISETNTSVVQNTQFQSLSDIVHEASKEVRRTAHNLMPDILLRNSIGFAVQEFCTYIRQDTSLDISVQIRGNLDTFDEQFKLNVYRIVQELVQNVLKHAQANTVLIQLQYSKNIFAITVEDNGAGFNTNQDYAGFGLSNIQNRVSAFGGQLSIDSEKGRGTSVYIEFPLAEENSDS